MNKKLKTLLCLCLAFLLCTSFFIACESNDEKTNDERIEYENDYEKSSTTPKIIEQQISSIKCKNELNSFLQKSKTQKNIKAELDRRIYNCYFDGTDSFVYIKKSYSEYWAGKVDNEYLRFNNFEDAKIFSIISQSDVEKTIQNANEDIFDDYLGSRIIKAIENAQGFECLKTTKGNIVVYQMKLIDFGSAQNFTITVVDELITEVLIDDKIAFICNYTGEKIIMPDKSDYEVTN